MKCGLGAWGTIVGALAFSVLPGAALAARPAEPVCWSQERGARVWPVIQFQRAADLDDYRRTLSQNRDEVRRALEGEYLQLLQGLAGSGGNPEALVEPVLLAVLAFDDLHDVHRDRAGNGVPLFLEVGFRTALDQLYRTNRIPDDRRRLRFSGARLADRVRSVRRGLGRTPGPSAGDLETLGEVPGRVDLVAHGAFSSDGKQQHVAITFENPRTGSQCNFEVAAAVEDVPYLLAEKVFQAFQAVAYPVVENPNPNLTWIRPVSDEPVMDPAQARLYCASQGEGARLPYAVELVTAAQVGADGVSYVEGGIPRLEPGPWVVADRLTREGPYYYFQPPDGRVDNHPAGAVRSGAGLGEVRARYWCVRGEPSARVLEIEGLYALHRRLVRARAAPEALAAVKYLLVRRSALSARRARSAPSFPDEVSARNALDRACLALGRGETPGVAVAVLGCPLVPGP